MKARETILAGVAVLSLTVAATAWLPTVAAQTESKAAAVPLVGSSHVLAAASGEPGRVYFMHATGTSSLMTFYQCSNNACSRVASISPP